MSKLKIPALLALAAFGLTSAGDANAQSVTRISQPVMNQQQFNQVGERPQMQGRQGRRGKQKKMMLMPGDVAKENIQKVTSEIRWNTNLNSALAQAARQHKMVLWVHLVGNLSGAT
ncbi:MAG: hypothetical protein SFY67_10150 [Candidatus Melainabacteria bacterium]|nr:hypothetical protein [Candidatus Melainabacteria bacterium]